MYISCGDERKNLTADGINPVKIGGRQSADAGAAIFRNPLYAAVNLGAAVVFGRTPARDNLGSFPARTLPTTRRTVLATQNSLAAVRR